MAIRVCVIHRVIAAICKQIIPQERITVQLTVCINKPAEHRIVIPALEIVESCLCIIVVPTITDRVDIRNCIAADAQDLTPGIVRIARNRTTAFVYQLNDIALLVQYIVVRRSVIYQCIRLALVVRDDVQYVLCPVFRPGLTRNLPIQRGVIVCYTIDRLAVPDPIRIVSNQILPENL